MTDHETRSIAPLLNLLANLQGPGPEPLGTARQERHGCRLVAICQEGVAISVAESLPSCLVILLVGGDSSASRFRRPKPQGRILPPNLEVLSCGLASAHFLPGSIAGVIALEQEDSILQSQASLRTIADWLEPGGILCVKGKVDSRWTWWFPSALTRSGMRTLARNTGLLAEDRSATTATGFRIFRKPDGSTPLSVREERHGSIAH